MAACTHLDQVRVETPQKLVLVVWAVLGLVALAVGLLRARPAGEAPAPAGASP